MDGSVRVRFTAVRNPIHYKMQFEGLASIQTAHDTASVEDLRVYGEYDSHVKSGWMSADLFSELITHRR